MVKVHSKTTEQLEKRFIADDDCKQRIARFIDQEGDSIRKGAEQESAHIIAKAREEYSQRLSRFLEEEGERIRNQAKRDAEETITKALEEKERIFTDARIMAKSRAEEIIKKIKIQAEQMVAMHANISKQRSEKIAANYRDECKKRAEQEAATIIDSANEQAIQIIAEAKERIKQQAGEEKDLEVKRIMESARLESAEIIAKARQAAEKEAEETTSKIISLAQQKAIQIFSETMEKSKNGEEKELAKLMSEEKYKSERETADIFAEVEQEAEQLIKKVINDTNGRGEVVDEDGEGEDVKEIAPVVETEGEAEEPGIREAIPDGSQVNEVIPTFEMDSVEEDKPSEADAAEFRETSLEVKDAKIEEEAAQEGQDTESIAEQKAENPMEVEEEEATANLEERPQPNDEFAVPTFEMDAAGKDKPVEADAAEFREKSPEVKDAKIEKEEAAIKVKDTESIYTGEVEVELGLSVDTDILAKLSVYLTHTPEIRLVRTVGYSHKGSIITVVLDKPIPLAEMLSSHIPEVQITGEPPDAKHKNHKKRRIHISRNGS